MFGPPAGFCVLTTRMISTTLFGKFASFSNEQGLELVLILLYLHDILSHTYIIRAYSTVLLLGAMLQSVTVGEGLG